MAGHASTAQLPQLHLESLDGRIVPDAVPANPNALSAHVILRTTTGTEPSASTWADTITPLGGGFYRADLRPGVDATSALRYYQARADVVTAAIDDVITVARTSNDAQAASQWSLAKTGTTTAWNVSTGTGNTVVAVIDTGVDTTHVDLQGNLWRNVREIAGNGRDDDGNGIIDDVFGADFANNDGDPYDDDGHGTHVAGIIAARGNNATGIAGVNWSGQIMSLKFLKSDGTGYTSDAVRAINYAVSNGVKIINLSWGGGNYNSALAAAIGQARAAGAIVVAAAGNNGNNSDSTTFYPAGYAATYDNVIVVGASTSSDTPASYSNYGRTAVTLFAPGSGILSLKPGNQYVTLSGTSMAAPFVSGALALLWDANPTLTASQVIARLRSSVDTSSAFNGLAQTNGRINVAKLLGTPVTSPTVPPITVPPPVATSPPTASSSPKTTHTKAAGTVAIPDFGSVAVPIVVDRDAIITDLDVRVAIGHAYVGDLLLKLTSPDGKSVILSNRRGGAGDNYTGTIFDDKASTAIGKGNAPYSGGFKPEQSLSLFNGMNARGTWTLSVADGAKGDAGTLSTATLILTGNPITTAQVVRKQAFVEVTVAPPLPRPATRGLMGYESMV